MHQVVSAPTETPISLLEIKEQLRIDHGAEDEYLSRLLKAATSYTERVTGIRLMTTVIDQWLNRWPGKEVVLDGGNVQTLTSVKAYNPSDQESIVSASVYRLDNVSSPARLLVRDGQSWPGTDLRTGPSIVIRLTCGWAAAASVPDDLRHAVALLASHWYRNREAVVVGQVTQLSADVSKTFDDLVRNFVRWN